MRIINKLIKRYLATVCVFTTIWLSKEAMWQRRTLSTPLVLHVQVHMYRNLTYFTVVVWLVCKNVWWGETQRLIHKEKRINKERKCAESKYWAKYAKPWQICWKKSRWSECESHGPSYWKPHSKLKTKISPYKWIINVKRSIHFSVIYHLLSYEN